MVLHVVVSIINFIGDGLHRFLSLSCHIGLYILLFFKGLYCLMCDICTIVIIVKDETYRFFIEAETAIADCVRYAHNSANDSINLVLDTIGLLLMHMYNFAKHTNAHTRLLATNIGSTLCAFAHLVRDAVLLLADLCSWLVVLPFKLAFHLLVAFVDFLLLSVVGSSKMALLMFNDVMQNVFRWTLGLTIILALYTYRRYIEHFSRNLMFYVLQLIHEKAEIVRSKTTQLLQQLTHTLGAPKRMVTTVINQDDTTELDDEMLPTTLCIACCDRAKCVLLLPCRHLCLCRECKDHLFDVAHIRHCPICRAPIDNFMYVYM